MSVKQKKPYLESTYYSSLHKAGEIGKCLIAGKDTELVKFSEATGWFDKHPRIAERANTEINQKIKRELYAFSEGRRNIPDFTNNVYKYLVLYKYGELEPTKASAKTLARLRVHLIDKCPDCKRLIETLNEINNYIVLYL